MLGKLQKDGFIGPFNIGNSELVSRLIRQLDSANNQFKNFHVSSETCRRLLSSEELKSQVELNFGKDLVLWRTNSFKKVDGSGEVAWHHDGTGPVHCLTMTPVSCMRKPWSHCTPSFTPFGGQP